MGSAPHPMSYKLKCVVCKSDFEYSSNQKMTCSQECHQKRILEKTGRRTSFNGLSTGTAGAISELEIAADLMRKGYAVFRALSPNCFCDLIAIKDGKVIRIECRTGYRANTDRVAFSNQTHGTIDCFGVYIEKERNVFYFKLQKKSPYWQEQKEYKV